MTFIKPPSIVPPITEYFPETIMANSVECLLEVNEVVVKAALVL